MFEVSGKYNTAKIFTDVVDNDAITQVIQLCNQPFAKNSQIRLMPDIHAGAGCTVGTTMTVMDKVAPSLVGSDIGCGMETILLEEQELDLSKFDQFIHSHIPAGAKLREETHTYLPQAELFRLHCYKNLELSRASKSLGTLGGGNHFIEAERNERGQLYLVVHSGSRLLGREVAKYYENAGYNARLYSKSEDTSQIVYLTGDLLTQYLHDMQIAQQFASLNRKAILDEILTKMKLHVQERFTTTHNYIDLQNNILRKGAVSAKAGEKLLIPINMRDGSLLCVGKGNEDWNFSAPHGAGRLMSRSEAKSTFTVSEYQNQMTGIYTTSIGQSTLDECPMAYKNMEDIINNIKETAEIVEILKPIYNFKPGKE